MVSHYFVLQALIEELNPLIRGATITEVFTQQKNELLISLTTRQSKTSEDDYRTLQISIDPRLNYLLLRENVTRAKKNSVDLFEECIDCSIEAVSLHPYDRTVRILLSKNLTLYLQLYNSAASNVLLVDASEVILEAFKKNKTLQGTSFTIQAQPFNNRLYDDILLFTQVVTQDPSKTVSAALKQGIPTFGSVYIREILHRADRDEDLFVHQLSNSDIEHIHAAVRTVINATRHPQPTIYFSGNTPKVISPIQLQHLANSKAQFFDSMIDAVRSFVVKSFQLKGVEAEKQELLAKIQVELNRSRKAFGAARSQLASSSGADTYEKLGKLILTNLQSINKGMTSMTVQNPMTGDTQVQIALDPKLTPTQNAERYFEKAKKAKASQEEVSTRLKSLAGKIPMLEALEASIEQCQTKEQIKTWRNQYAQELKAWHIIKGKQAEEKLPFRIFTLRDGYEVWVGKSRASNDLLTMKYTKPNDLWFHARGASGSHTVLKVKGHTSAPSKEAIQRAAAIAAYYSKMRNATNVAVAYCERKYVRKPRKSPPGTVIIEHEKTIFVKPTLP
ncbi:MAG: DUF814 domain-containing protein [Ignavibacteriae bacterium]|nr:DUF814 domain-containing protein [Ignavibacteriota bacterium]